MATTETPKSMPDGGWVTFQLLVTVPGLAANPDFTRDDVIGHAESIHFDTVELCRHCGRAIIFDGCAWIDPDPTGDDRIWREACDSHDTFTAEHEPVGTA